jgi:hypothetical protein
MAATYIDMIAKLQDQGLDVLKQAQKAHIDALTSAREFVEKLPAPPQVPQIPAIEGLPTIAQVTELSNAFVANVVELQKSYATQLAEVFAPIKKNSI